MSVPEVNNNQPIQQISGPNNEALNVKDQKCSSIGKCVLEGKEIINPKLEMCDVLFEDKNGRRFCQVLLSYECSQQEHYPVKDPGLMVYCCHSYPKTEFKNMQVPSELPTSEAHKVYKLCTMMITGKGVEHAVYYQHRS